MTTAKNGYGVPGRLVTDGLWDRASVRPGHPAAALAISALVLAASLARADHGLLVQDSIIDPLAHNFPTITFGLPNVHGVAFQQEGVTTYKGWQYAAYYQGNSSDSSGKVGVARRPLPNGTWEVMILNDYLFTTVDSHNNIVIGICPADGTIHLSFDHHGNALNYRVSIPGAADRPAATAWTPALFGPITDHLVTGGMPMTGVTYPSFIPTPAGKLLFNYRSGSSSNGNAILYEYDGTLHEWSLVGKYVTPTGTYTGPVGTSTRRNSYFDYIHFGPEGRLNATWCWREPGGGVANHDLLYAYSDDVGRTWKNQLGAVISVTDTSFITLDSPGILGWSIPQNRNYINNSAMTTDRQRRIHVVAWHLPDGVPDNLIWDASITSGAVFNHYWRGTDGIWHKNETSFTGTRAKLAADDDGRLFLIYGDATNVRIAAANPATDPEGTPADSWIDWAPLDLSAALPEGRANAINTIIDPLRWKNDRIFSVYGQETNISGSGPTPLHILDYHVSRGAAGPMPADDATFNGVNPELKWLAGLESAASDVYFGTNEASVHVATTASAEYLGRQTHTVYQIGPLQVLTEYFWRIDSVADDGSVTLGRVWSFTAGDPQIGIGRQDSSRSYGGRATFSGKLVIEDEAASTGEVTLYYGNTDGGTEATAWQRSASLGPLPAGDFSITLDAIPAGIIHYRFQASTDHSSGWAPATGVLAGRDDLFHWAHTAAITFPGYAGVEPLSDFPVLIRLSSTDLQGFSHDQLLSPPYGDLRFSTSDGTLLPYEIENWNPSGTSLIWVKAPLLSATTVLRIWWGKTGESSPPTSADVWSGGFNGIWHLDPALGFAKDSSASQLTGAAIGIASTDGVIPGASAFDGGSSTIVIDNAASLNPQLISVEAWVKSNATGIVSIFGKDQTGSSANRVWQFRLNAGKPELIVFSSDTIKTIVTSPDAINDNLFHHVCGTWDGSTARIHVDGLEKNSAALTGSLNPDQTNAAFIGSMQTSSPCYFSGTIDEVRLSSTARSDDWIKATYESQKPASSFLTISPPATPDIDGDHLPDAWEITHFNSIHARSADYDSDHFVDLLEFALGSDPASSADFPSLSIIPGTGGSAPEFIYTQIAGGSGQIGGDYSAAGLLYTVEISTDAISWQRSGEHAMWSGRREILPNGMERVGVFLHSPSPVILARLAIQPAPPATAATLR